MKVLLINTYERTGGAAVACRRLMQVLCKEGVSARMLVSKREAQTNGVEAVYKTGGQRKLFFLRFAWERFTIFWHNRFSRKNLFAVSIANTGCDISRHPLVQEADIIHLHWVNQGFLSLQDIDRLIRTGKPVVWTLHDMWPATAICHHARDCHRFEQQCGECLFLAKPSESDLSARVFQQKSKLPLSNVLFVACSGWLAQKAEASALIGQSAVTSIPNPIDLSFWTQQDRTISRHALLLPLDKKLLLFVAVKATDPRKGIDYLVQAVERLVADDLENRNCMGVVVVGHWDEAQNSRFALPVYPVGYLSDEEQLRALYSAVDLFVTSSLEENLPNTVMEAMACSCPVVGFEVGGIPEMIVHEQTGYIARYTSADDLATGIHTVLHHPQASVMGQSARAKAEQCYDERVVARQYIRLYHTVSTQKNHE